MVSQMRRVTWDVFYPKVRVTNHSIVFLSNRKSARLILDCLFFVYLLLINAFMAGLFLWLCLGFTQNNDASAFRTSLVRGSRLQQLFWVCLLAYTPRIKTVTKRLPDSISCDDPVHDTTVSLASSGLYSKQWCWFFQNQLSMGIQTPVIILNVPTGVCVRDKEKKIILHSI